MRIVRVNLRILFSLYGQREGKKQTFSLKLWVYSKWCGGMKNFHSGEILYDCGWVVENR